MSILERLWHSFTTWGMSWGGLAGVVGICLLLLWFFTPPFLSSPTAKTWILNVGISCVLFALLSAYFIQRGYSSCTSLFNSRDAAAITRAKEAVKEIETCRDGGGSWDVVEGSCIPKPSQ